VIIEQLFNVNSLLEAYGYIGIFVIIFLESGVFPPLPGDSLLFTAGLFATTGVFNISILIPLVIIAGFLGIVSGYQVGENLLRLQKYRLFQKFFKDEHLDKAHEFFEKHGKYSIITSRFVPLVRTFVPIVAGAAKMDYTDFIKYSFVGSIFWACTFILSGFFLGKIFPSIGDYLFWVIIVVVVVSTLPLLYQYLAHKKK
jgi:membrane-associated protein